jgi:hypothetical protein
MPDLAKAPESGYTNWRHGTFSMLTGSELIAKVKELKDVSKSELVRECGYVKNGKLCFTAFYEAILAAKGLEIGAAAKPGRTLTYKTKVQFNGKLQIGEGYVKEMGFKPGDEFEIKVGRKSVTLQSITQEANNLVDFFEERELAEAAA